MSRTCNRIFVYTAIWIKNLDTKSKFSEIELTIIPLALIFAISGMLGSIFEFDVRFFKK